MTKPKVLIIGGGFGGIQVAKGLATARVDVTLLDRKNHHCFQPLLYQVATATLAPSDVAWPIRSILSGQRNVTVLMAEVNGVDAQRKVVQGDAGEFAYDQLVIATGATHAYFGHQEWAQFAPGLKQIEDATEIRRRILIAFERAEVATDPETRLALTTFVIVGGGPTGVELAGAIADMARQALPRDFRNVNPADARIILVEAGPRLLSTFPKPLSEYARAALARRGVEVQTGTPVTAIAKDGVSIGDHPVRTGAVIWAAGVAASPAAEWLKADRDRAGRVKVHADLTLSGHPDIFVIGDTAAVLDAAGKPVPGIAPAAKQMGSYVASVITRRAAGKGAPPPFRYKHQGDLATIGRKAAVVRLPYATLKGFVGWAFWGIAHVYFLVDVRNRAAVVFTWLWEYITLRRGARLITEAAGSSIRPAKPGRSSIGTPEAPHKRENGAREPPSGQLPPF